MTPLVKLKLLSLRRKDELLHAKGRHLPGVHSTGFELHRMRTARHFLHPKLVVLAGRHGIKAAARQSGCSTRPPNPETRPPNPVLSPGARDGLNASAPDLFEWNGTTVLCDSGGDPFTWFKLKRVTHPAPLDQFLAAWLHEPVFRGTEFDAALAARSSRGELLRAQARGGSGNGSSPTCLTLAERCRRTLRP